MENKVFLFASIPLLSIILVFAYLNINQKSLAPNAESTNSDICQTIEYNGEDRIDLLFISSKEIASHYKDVLFNNEPYKTYRNYFNLYVLEAEPECDNYKGIAILCKTKQVEDLAKNCKHDYIIAVKTDDPKIRSSAYGNVLSINSVHEDSVLIHEMGHALANLAEEYGGAKIPSGSKNCVSSCDKFNGGADSCTQECSDSNYYRSIYAGVMRTLATSNYGKYDIALVTQILEKNKPKKGMISGNQIKEDTFKCNNEIMMVTVQGNKVSSDNILQKGCYPDKGLAGPLCIGDVCNINTLFTDAQIDETNLELEGETYLDPEVPLTFYIGKDQSNPNVEVTLDNQIIGTINTAQAGATACTN